MISVSQHLFILALGPIRSGVSYATAVVKNSSAELFAAASA